MSLAIPLQNIAAYLIEEIGRAYALGKTHAEGAVLASVELRVAFTTADGQSTPRIIDLGDVSLSPESLPRGVPGLEHPVYVDAAELMHAQADSMGHLIMRVLIGDP